MIWSSTALYCLNRLAVVGSTSSCGWPNTLSFNFFKTRSTSGSTRMRALASIPLMEYDVLFPSIFVKSLILRFTEDGSSFAIHSVAFLRDCFFSSGVCSPVWSSLYACVKRIVLRLQHLRRMLSPQWVLLVHLPWLRERYSPWLSILLWRENPLLWWLNQRYVLFWNWIVTHNRMRCKRRRKSFCLKETCHWFIVCYDKCRFWWFPQNVCELEKRHVSCQDFFRVNRHF